MRQTRLGYFSHDVITKISLTKLDNICLISVFIVKKNFNQIDGCDGEGYVDRRNGICTYGMEVF